MEGLEVVRRSLERLIIVVVEGEGYPLGKVDGDDEIVLVCTFSLELEVSEAILFGLIVNIEEAASTVRVDDKVISVVGSRMSICVEG